MIPTRMHAVLDYVLGVILLALPYLTDAWGDGGAKV